MNFEDPVSREDIYKAKSEFRKRRAATSLDDKMVALVRMQMINYEMAATTGRVAPKPWLFEDPIRLKKILESG